MQITFLGTSSGVPTRSRNVSSVALRLPQKSEIWLFDCGEGTQHQLLKSKLRLSQIKKIFITHMHGDHIFGLPGLLASLGLAGKCSGIQIFGPFNLREYLEGIFKSCSIKSAFPIEIIPIEKHAINKDEIYRDKDIAVNCAPLDHRVPSYGYRVNELPKPGRFNLNLAKKLDIPPGPAYAALQRGERVKLEDGRVLEGVDFTGPPRKGLSIAYCTDTIFSKNAISLATDADLLIHESTFSHLDADLAFKRSHSTSTMAAQTALEAKVGQLILTHLSPRYAPNNEITANNLLDEARSIFPNTALAKDFLEIDVKKRCNSL